MISGLYAVYRQKIEGFVNNEPLEEQSCETLLSLIYSLYATIDKIETERDAIRETMDKFLHAISEKGDK